jgi:AraC-like DNA-binding protein
VGLNPLEYMTKLRMKKAETMLGPMWAKGNSIADVAELCGFDDALYFSRVFKKFYGCSPSNFSKKMVRTYPKDPGRRELPVDKEVSD